MKQERSELERRIIYAESLGKYWGDLYEVWLQLDNGQKNFLASLMNDLDDGKSSEAKLERLARGTKEYREYCKNVAIAKGLEIRAKVKYENARDYFEAGRSQESTEREKMKHLSQIP